MATKKTVKASEEPQEENQEVQNEEVKAEVKTEEVVTKELEVNSEEIVLENPIRDPIVVRDEEPVLRDEEEQAEEDPKTFDDVYTLLEQIDGKLDVIIRGL